MKKNLKAKVIELLSQGRCLQAACDQLAVNQSTVWKWRQDDRRFAEAVAEAIFLRRHGKELARLRSQVAALEAQFGGALTCR